MIDRERLLFGVKFYVRGTPKGQPRPRAAMNRKTGRAFVHTAGTAEAWKASIISEGEQFRPDEPLDSPLRVRVVFFMPRPKALCRKKDPNKPILCPKKPDRDNLDKAVLDALTDDGWFKDDSIVCLGGVEKFYHAKNRSPGAWIIIEELPENVEPTELQP